MKKLVLFDIDGTLIRHFGPESTINIGWYRFVYALKRVFDIDVTPNPKRNYHGGVDRAILFDIASRYGVTKVQFDARFEDVKMAVIDYAHTRETKQIYEAIPEGVQLIHLLRNFSKQFLLGILTGNVEKMAYWKLRHVGIDPSWFTLFITSDEFEDRISLAKSVFLKVEKDAGIFVSPGDIYIIGDAVGDILCAHAIGVSSIIATTGRHKKDELRAEHPTLLVDSLMDTRVLSLLGLK